MNTTHLIEAIAEEESMHGEYTPGPWRIGDAGNTVFGPPSDQPAPVTIATLPNATPRVPAIRRQGNARLIAAAPALLAVCERILRAIEWSESADRMTSEEQAAVLRGVIEQATT